MRVLADFPLNPENYAIDPVFLGLPRAPTALL